ncbi:unnamed protein product [marine sediment metagenome]|uniref:Uncharacterized protein n=1 Tax=marine sediment metagenome TaxID=412755 RepID=X1GMW9_9ZZZZ
MDLEEIAHVGAEKTEIQKPRLAIQPNHQKSTCPGYEYSGKD